jgi:hypothetical protein
MEIATKAEFYRRQERDLFGNKMRTWMGTSELFGSGHTGTVSIRHRTTSGAKLTAYEVPVPEVEGFLRLHEVEDVQSVVFNESAPDHLLVVQGEIWESPTGLVMRASTEKAKMREAMKYASHFRGLFALNWLRGVMDPASCDDLRTLLDLYDGHVIEFGVYSVPVGQIPHRNTLFWEVRGDY